MGPLSIEQKLQQHSYNSSEATNTGPSQVNLGGFAISFEDLLQRVGVRLEQAFGAADQSAGLAVSNNNPQADNDDRDYASNRDTSSDHGDDRGDNHRNDANVTSSTDQRDNGSERSADNGHDSNSSNDHADHNDTRGNDDHAPKDKADRSDASSKSDDTSDTADASADGEATNDGANQNDANGKGQNANGNATEQTAASNATSVNHASAIYSAGLIGNAGADASKTGNVKASQQTGKTQEVVTGPATQVDAGATRKGVHTAQGNIQQNVNNQNANAQAGQQQVANAGDKGVNANIQDQVQQMSRLMGANNRANVSVNVNTEQNQLTSRPTLTAANASILTPTTGNNGNAGTQAQTGQNQGQNAQTGAQAQAATQVQANVNAQATAQVANQAQGAGGNIQTGPSTAGITTSAGGGQHGAGETLNSTTQTASAAQTAQQTQQTQQTREAQPQQQTQQAQRGNAAGASVSDQISVKITKALQTGVDRISIQLRPAELGRVDVKLEMTHDGRVMTVVTAEKQDTLDLLRRDSSELQRALADAGLKNGDMEFNLKGQEQQTAEGDDAKNGDASNQAEADSDDATDDPNDGVLTAWESGIFADGSVDMRA